ncbi:unnamed protein product [Pylaiella littoralis]
MVYHAVNSSRGNATSLAVRHSKVSATVELLRAVAISGAYLSPKRLQELEDVCAQVRSTALDVLSGIDGAEGGLRTEVTYLCNTDRQTAVDLSGVFELMCGDLVGEVFGVENGGWNDAEASLSLPASSVYCLMHALFARSLESMRYGFGGQRVADPDSGDVLREQLPLGYLPSLAESILRTDAKAIRLPAGVGSALRAGQAASGFLGASWNRFLTRYTLDNVDERERGSIHCLAAYSTTKTAATCMLLPQSPMVRVRSCYFVS